jgi:hypothetical protein
VDGTLFFTAAILFIAAGGDDFATELKRVFSAHRLELFFGLLPLSAVAGWRGKLDAERILNGENSLRRAALEGFSFGFVLPSLAIYVSTIYAVVAAGGGIEEEIRANPANIRAWAALVILTSVIGIVAGGVSAVTASTLHLLNRVLIRIL